MKFGESYENLKQGGYISRKDWNGSFLWLKQKTSVKSEWCKDPILKMIADANGGSVEAEQTICKYDANMHKVITGWVPQQEDMAAEDWGDCYVSAIDGVVEGRRFDELDEKKKKKTSDFIGDLFENAEVFKKP